MPILPGRVFKSSASQFRDYLRQEPVEALSLQTCLHVSLTLTMAFLREGVDQTRRNARSSEDKTVATLPQSN